MARRISALDRFGCVFGLIGLLLPPAPARADPPVFHKQVLTAKYYCDGITAGDLNRDGRMDVVAGPFWYEGPDFRVRHEFYPAKELEPAPSPSDSLTIRAPTSR